MVGEEKKTSLDREEEIIFPLFLSFFFSPLRLIFVLYTQLCPTYQSITHFSSYYKTDAVVDDGGGRRWRREMRGSHTER